ncbi:unnamed protein product, partial [Meganyctiphanes norvegica]
EDERPQSDTGLVTILDQLTSEATGSDVAGGEGISSNLSVGGQGGGGGGDLGQLGNSHAGEVARDVNGSNTGAAENDNETETNSEEIYEAETDVPEYVDVRNLTKMIGLNNSDIESVKDQVIKMYKAMGVLFSLLTPGCLKEAKQKNEVEVRKNNVLRRLIADAEDGILAKNLSKVV